MATDEVVYLTFTEAALAHIELMRHLGETRYGVFDRALVESALARPRHAAIYENADIQTQAATLLLGLVKNHPWVGGNKRTATALVELFLNRNGFELAAATAELVELVIAVESGEWPADAIDLWLRRHTKIMQP